MGLKMPQEQPNTTRVHEVNGDCKHSGMESAYIIDLRWTRH